MSTSCLFRAPKACGRSTTYPPVLKRGRGGGSSIPFIYSSPPPPQKKKRNHEWNFRGHPLPQFHLQAGVPTRGSLKTRKQAASPRAGRPEMKLRSPIERWSSPSGELPKSGSCFLCVCVAFSVLFFVFVSSFFFFVFSCFLLFFPFVLLLSLLFGS